MEAIDRIRPYFQKYFPLSNILDSSQAEREKLSFNSFRVPLGMRIFLTFLKICPYLCLTLFAGIFSMSLFQTGSVASFYASNQVLFEAVLTVSVSGLIGFGTNFIAIRMLFRPVTKRPIWGQGLIPAQRDRIIFTLAQGMHNHILNQDLIKRRVEESGLVKRINDILNDGTTGLLQDDEIRELMKSSVHDGILEFSQKENIRKEIHTIIDNRLERTVEGGMKKLLFQTYKRINKEDYASLINKVVEDLPKVAVEVMNRLDNELDRLGAFVRKNRNNSENFIMDVFVDVINRVDIVGLLQKQMEHFDEAKLEKMVWEATNEQLLYIQYLGTILGILGGLLIWNTQLMLMVYAVIFAVLYLLDVLIFRLQKRKLEPAPTKHQD